MSTSPVLGVNLGSTYVSAAILNLEGHAEILVDQDGQRQFAQAISFNEDEEYIGNGAKSQLVTNSANTILSFRDYLGKKFSNVQKPKTSFAAASAPLIDSQGSPAFKVTARNQELILTSQEAAVRLISHLYSSAEAVFGQKPSHVAFALPSTFSKESIQALKAASEQAGFTSMDIVTMSEAALVAYDLDDPSKTSKPVDLSRTGGISGTDANVVVLDVGATSTSVSVYASRDGLHVPLAQKHSDAVGGNQIDDKLVEFFSKEFTKKTKVQIDPKSDTRSMTKLYLAVEETKRSLSASTSATCSIESLKEGMDYHGNITRLRLNLLTKSIYQTIGDLFLDALKEANIDPLQVDKVICSGGSSRIPALRDHIASLVNPADENVIQIAIQPDEVIAKGAVLHAAKSTTSGPAPSLDLASSTTFPTLSKPIGLVLPGGSDDEPTFVTLLQSSTPLPARRIVSFKADPQNTEGFAIQLWEGQPDIKVTKPEPKQTNGQDKEQNGDDDDDEDFDEDDEDEETRTPIVKPTSFLGQVTSSPSDKNENVKLTIIVDKSGKGTLEATGAEPLQF